jgi:hypothetical protein
LAGIASAAVIVPLDIKADDIVALRDKPFRPSTEAAEQIEAQGHKAIIS